MIHIQRVEILLFLLYLGLGTVAAQITKVSATSIATCNGSLHLYLNKSAPIERKSYGRSGHIGDVRNIPKSNIWKAKVEGCGCVVIYSKKDGGGSSMFLKPPQTIEEGDSLFLKKVKSFKIVNCLIHRTNVLQSVIISVVVAVILVGLGGTICIIIERKLVGKDREDSEDPVQVTTIEEIENCTREHPDAPPQVPTVKETEM